MSQIKFTSETEFRAVIEKPDELSNSLFKNIYNKALRNIYQITRENEEGYRDKKRNKEKNGQTIKSFEGVNNITAFMGDRGTGKTSTMLSFLNYLLKIDKVKEHLDEDYHKKLEEYEFITIDVIDPSFLEKNESILETVIAKMFSKFQENLDNYSFEDKKEFIKQFQNIYRAIRLMTINKSEKLKNDAYSEDIIESLVGLASSSNMRECISELVDVFLDKMGNGRNTKKFLIIPIDDLDNNLKQSVEIAEQIRKYLMIPNVIILMSLKGEQLKDSVEETFYNNYRNLTEKGRLSDDPKQMAEKYLEKLIPNGRKIHLLRMDDIKLMKKVKFDVIIEEENNDTQREFNGTLEEVLIRYTYIKTGMIFIAPKKSLHPLVPKNLREYSNYISILSKLKDINRESDSDDKRINIEVFKNYVVNQWGNRCLTKKYYNIVQEFILMDSGEKNHYVVTNYRTMLNKNLEKIIKNDFNKDKIFGDINTKIASNPIFNINNISRNISIGDVLEVFNLYSSYDDENIKNFKFMIKCLYSIMFYENLLIEKDQESVLDLLGGNINNCFRNTQNHILRNVTDMDIEDLIELKFDNIQTNLEIECIVEEVFLRLICNEIEEKELLDDLNECSEELINNYFKIRTRERIRNLEYFFSFLTLNKNNIQSNYREDSSYDNLNEYNLIPYDAGNNLIYNDNAKFEILKFINYTINPQLVFSKIFNYYIKNLDFDKLTTKLIDRFADYEVEYYDEFESEEIYDGLIDLLDEGGYVEFSGDEYIFRKKPHEWSEKISCAIFEESLSYELIKWKKDFDMVLPLHSIEILEVIFNRVITNFNFNNEELFEVYSGVFDLIDESLEYVLNEVEDVLGEEFDTEKLKIMQAYKQCVYIKMTSEENRDLRKILGSSFTDSMTKYIEWMKIYGEKIKTKSGKDTLLYYIDEMIDSSREYNVDDETIRELYIFKQKVNISPSNDERKLIGKRLYDFLNNKRLKQVKLLDGISETFNLEEEDYGIDDIGEY